MFNLDQFVEILNTWPAELVSVSMLCFTLISMFLFLRFFGQLGLYTFLSLLVVVGNIQVLKAAYFSFIDDAVALGTIVFSITYLCTDILTEYFDKKAAQKAVWISFASMLFISIGMLITVGWAPLDPVKFGPSFDHFRLAHDAMKVLFLPAPTIFTASLIAYLISQYNDIWIFHSLKVVFRGQYVGLRSFLASAVSALIDSSIFSFLAWYVFAPVPIPLPIIIKTYILGTYGIRVCMGLINAPMVHFAKYFLPRGSHARLS